MFIEIVNFNVILNSIILYGRLNEYSEQYKSIMNTLSDYDSVDFFVHQLNRVILPNNTIIKDEIAIILIAIFFLYKLLFKLSVLYILIYISLLLINFLEFHNTISSIISFC